MARIGRDSSSWKAGGVLRRDARQVRDNPNVRHPAKKDTRHWCKGKVGRGHVIASRPIQMGGSRDWGDEDYCRVCSKTLVQRWKPFPWTRQKVLDIAGDPDNNPSMHTA